MQEDEYAMLGMMLRCKVAQGGVGPARRRRPAPFESSRNKGRRVGSRGDGEREGG